MRKRTKSEPAKKPDLDQGLKIIIDNPEAWQRWLSTTSTGRKREVASGPKAFSLPLLRQPNSAAPNGTPARTKDTAPGR